MLFGEARAPRNRSFYNRLRRTTIGTGRRVCLSGDHWPRGRLVESIPADPSRNRVTRGIFRNRAAAPLRSISIPRSPPPTDPLSFSLSLFPDLVHTHPPIEIVTKKVFRSVRCKSKVLPRPRESTENLQRFDKKVVLISRVSFVANCKRTLVLRIALHYRHSRQRGLL